MKRHRLAGWLAAVLLVLSGQPVLAQGQTVFLLDLPSDKAAVRYSHGSLDRAVGLQDNFELMVEDFRSWTRVKVGLVLLLLSRDDWQQSGFDSPYGMPEPSGGRGLAIPSWGDDGTVELWRGLLGTRLPTQPEQPMRGTPEQSASLAIADLMASVDGARVLLRSAGIRGDQPWVDGVITHVVVLSNIQNHHAVRLPDVRMIFDALAARGGGPGAHALTLNPTSLADRLWLESQFSLGAATLLSPGCKSSPKTIFKQARKNGGLIQATDLMARCPALDGWLKTSFRVE